MNFVFYILIFISGIFIKISDDYFDEKNKKIKKEIIYILSILSGFFLSICTKNYYIATLFFAIYFSLVLTKKIDNLAHILNLFCFCFFSYLFSTGFSFFYFLYFCIFSSVDEIMDDENNKFLKKKFLISKRIYLLISIIFILFLNFNFLPSFFALISFDFGYNIKKYKKLNFLENK